MAEIPVEKKSSRTWLWLLLAAILVVLLIWWLSSGNDNVVDEDAVATAPAGTLDTVDQSAMDPAGPMTLAAILAQPQSYIGQTFTGEVGVDGPLTDRGFWVQNDGARMFAIIIDEPREVPMDINAGQQLMVSGGRIHEGGAVSDVEGVPLDQDTLDVIADQAAFMIVDEANIEILQGA